MYSDRGILSKMAANHAHICSLVTYFSSKSFQAKFVAKAVFKDFLILSRIFIIQLCYILLFAKFVRHRGLAMQNSRKSQSSVPLKLCKDPKLQLKFYENA